MPPSSGDDFLYPFTPFVQPPGYNDACRFTPPPPPGWAAPSVTTARCSWDPTDRDSWRVNREQTTTQAFYYVNHFHDHLAGPTIGFTDATDAFGGDGTGDQDDPVIVNSDDGGEHGRRRRPGRRSREQREHVTPPDGQSPLMQMYLFEFNPDSFFNFRNINGDDDAGIVYHEYTHGLSNRLVTNADGSGAVSSPHAGAMGEAWSDWYALDLLHREGLEIDDPSTVGDVDIGAYSDAVFTTLRFSPADCPPSAVTPTCPGGLSTGIGGFTFGDFGKVFAGPEVHSDGEIWVQTLWDLRTLLVLGTGSEQDGSDLAEALVTEAMRLSPPEPSFLDMRNSILVADEGITGGDLQDLIWSAFAGRGMGFYASVADSSDVTPIEDFNLPPAPDAPTGTVAGTVTDGDTGLPLEGITVGFGGHTTGPAFPSSLTDTTDAEGHYSSRPRWATTASWSSRATPGSTRSRSRASSSTPTKPRPTTSRCAATGRPRAAGRPSPAATTPARPSAAATTSSSTSRSAPAGRRSTPTAPIPRTRMPARRRRRSRCRSRSTSRPWAWTRATPAATAPRRRPRTTGC